MPTTSPSPGSPQPTPPAIQEPRNWLPSRQDYAVLQERARHDDALWAFGEYAIFCLMWGLDDLAAGRVTRCLRCYEDSRVAEVYNQPKEKRCPSCYGTTLEGGVKALIVRACIWDSTEENYRTVARGEFVTQTVSIQSTSDFRLRTGDYIFRSDGSRYQMSTMSSNELRTGFATPTAATSVVGYNYGTVNREDQSSVAYMIPPTEQVVMSRLQVPYSRRQQDFSDIERINGPLLA